MKTPKIATLSIALLVTLLVGAIAVNVFSAPPELKLKAKWKPAEFTMDSWIPDPWLVQIYFAPPRPISEIDPSTIKLENTYSPSATPYPHAIKDRLVVPFRGYDVLTVLVSKAPHMQPGIFEIFLEIEGQLYDGRYFKGTGSINMTIPELPPP